MTIVDPSKLFPGYWSSQLAIDRTRKHTVSESLSMIDDILDAAVSDVEKAADDICNLPTDVATDADPTAMWNTQVIPQPMTSVAVEVTRAAGAALSPIAAVPSSNTQLRPTIFHKDDASRDVQSSAEEGQKLPLCSVINTPLQQPLYVKTADRNVLTPINATDGRAMIQVIPNKIPPVNILSDQPQSFIPSTLSQVVSQDVPQENIVIAGHQSPHPVVQPIAQATQPRAHILTQAMPQPRTHIAVQPMPQPKTQVGPQVIVQPRAHSVVQPAAQLTAQTVVQPTAQLTAQTVVQPSVDAIAQTVVQPAAQTVVQPTAQLTAQTVVQPRAHPIAQTVVQPAAQLTAQTVVHPAAQLTAQTVVQHGAQLPAQTVVQPIAQTVVQPTAQLTAQTVVQPGAQTVIQPRAHTMQFSGAHMAAHTMPPPDVHNDSAPFIFELNGRRYLGQPLPAHQPPVPVPSHVPQQMMSPPNVCSQSATPQSTTPVPHARQETKYRKFAKKYGHVPSSTSEANPGRKALIDAVGDVLRRNTPTERTADPIDTQTNTSDTNVVVPKKHAGELTITVPNVSLTDVNTQPIVPTPKDYQKSNERNPIVTNSVDSNVSSSKEHYDMAYEAALGISKALSSAKSLPNTVDSSKTSDVGQCVYINADGSITTTPPEDDSDDNSDDDSPVVYIEPSLKPAQSTADAHVVPNSRAFGMNPRSTTQSAALPQTLAHCTSHSTELTQFSPYVTQQYPTPNTNAAGYMHMQMSKICPPNPTHPFIRGVAPQEMTRPIYEAPYRRSSSDSLPDRPPSVQTPSVRSSSRSPVELVELGTSEPSHIIVSVPITTDVTSQYTSAIAAHSSSVQYPNDLIGQPIQQSGLQYTIHPSMGTQVQYNNPAVTMPVIQNSPYHTNTPVSHLAAQHQAYPASHDPTIVQYNEPHRVTHSQGTVQYRHPTPQPQPHVRYTTRVQHLVPSPVPPVHVTQSPTRYYVRPQMLSPTNTSAYRVPYSTLNVNSLLHPSEHIPTPVYLPSTRGQQVIAHSTSGLSPANAAHSVTLPSPHYSSDTDIDVTSYSSPMRPKGFLAPEGITIAHPSPPKPKGDSDDSDEEEEKTEIIMNVIYD